MSATLIAKGLAAGHGTRALFSGLDLVVAPGDVIGLVGVNGAGKSTLLRLLAGQTTPEAGSIALTPPSATVGLLDQEPERRPGETVRDFLARRTGVASADQTLQNATEALTSETDDAAHAYSDALERWLHLGGADLDERSASTLVDLGIDLPLDAPMPVLSGGEAARVGLAALMLSRFDVLLLDEPTNDLDLDGLARLERFVTGARAPVVLVSHDREFLARTVTSVLELDLAQQRIRQVGGGYEAYLAERALAHRHERERYEQFAGTRSELEARARTQRAWMEKGVRNARRKAPDNDKIGAAFRGETSEKQAAKASQTDRLIERLEQVEEPRKEWQLQLEIAAAPRSGSVVASLRGANLSRGAFTLGPLDLQLDWADRVAITGANGSGKTTLLSLLLGKIGPDDGVAELGSGVIVGEVDQARALFSHGDTLARVFAEQVPTWPDSDVRTLLAKFGLAAEHVLRPPASLSPGERTRAALALLQARGVNLLVLDEPTNHLDLPAIEQLEAALDSYSGTLLLVTHDRRMLDAVSVTRRWQVQGGQVTER